MSKTQYNSSQLELIMEQLKKEVIYIQKRRENNQPLKIDKEVSDFSKNIDIVSNLENQIKSLNEWFYSND
jgi:hypothetical protein